jgi:hypothetical protein
VSVDSGDGGSVYTIQFDGESQSEFDKFLKNKLVREERGAFERLISRLEAMTKEYGFKEEQFKEKEGKKKDYVVALSEGVLRLYCLRIENTLLIIGNGGVKRTRTYQQDSHLNSSVEDLQMVNKCIMRRIFSGGIHVDRITGELRGSLNFL